MPNWKKVIVSGSEAHLTSVTSSNGVNLADNAFLNLGDGNDLQLYHDGDNSYIKDAGTGGLFYRGGTQTFQNAAGSKTMAVLNAANSVDLNFNNSTKFQTTNTGVSVTGEVVATANVSSSLVSTGSFGDGRFASRLSVGTQESPSLYDSGADTLLVSEPSGNAGITIRGATSGNTSIHFADGTSGNAAYRGVLQYGHGDDSMRFYTAGSSRMSLDSSGILKDMAGVSGSSVSTGSFARLELDGFTISKAGASDKQLVFGNTSEGADIFHDTSAHELRLTSYSSAVKSSEIHLQGRAAGDGASRGGILFRTATHQHTTNGPQDAVYINLSGSVELMRDGANISGSSTSTGSFGRVETDGDISGSVIRASGDIIAFNSSDERLKDNLTYIHRPIEKINQIGGYEFDWNEKQQVYHGHDVGVLAQELEKVLPEAVKDRDSGYKGVQYDKIIPLLIEGIKELTNKTKKLEKEIKKLKHKK